MDYTKLGRTGLRVSVMGIGCGGPSRLGQRSGKPDTESIAVIRRAIDSGINFFDTAEAYGTEELLGKAIKTVERQSVILSSKKTTQEHITARDLQQSLEDSLKRLDTDYIDIYNLHGVLHEDYDYLVSEIYPLMVKMRDQGKIRFLGITEEFNRDTNHVMLERALKDDIWDVVMVGFNILNQSARDSVLKSTLEKDVGVLVMFAVRLALSKPERLKQVIDELIRNKKINPSSINVENPLGFLVHENGAVSLTDAAYRFCRYEPGTHVILSGTGNADHLEQNIASFSRPVLPEEDIRKIQVIFKDVDSVTGQ